MDSISSFLKSRQGDFVRLQDSDKDPAFGPGPLLLLYQVPARIDDAEIRDMMADAAPTVQQDCRVVRLHARSPELDLPLQDALQILVSPSNGPPASQAVSSGGSDSASDDVPVLYFSGIRNDDMLRLYNLLGREIYEETAGRSAAACAKVVPRALAKPLRQVLEEIAGDHRDALRLDQETQPLAQ